MIFYPPRLRVSLKLKIKIQLLSIWDSKIILGSAL